MPCIHIHIQTINISQIRSINRRIAGVYIYIPTVSATKSILPIYGQYELDSHVDTIVLGNNCVILSYSGREYYISPCRDDYDSIKEVPIVNITTI